MNAQYFYKRLLGYEDERRETELYYYGYSNNAVEIHHRGDEDNWFTVYGDGQVFAYHRHIHGHETLHVDNLDGDDFELFSTVQVYKSGYIVLDTQSEYDVKRVITKLYYHINSFEDIYDDNTKNIPVLCDGSMWNNGVTDGFQYYAATSTVELKIRTIRSLCKENINRKHYGARVYPFKKYMHNSDSCYVTFVANMENKKDKVIRKNCEDALKELLSYMEELDIKCKWVDCNLKYPIYE